jgi:flagellin
MAVAILSPGTEPGQQNLLCRGQRTENAMLSVNTNPGAMIALQYLDQTNAQLQTTQTAIDTGMTVSSPEDNGAIFAIAQDMRGNVAGYQAVSQSLDRATSSVSVAISAGQSISNLLIQMKQDALSASDQSLNTASRQALNSSFAALRSQIASIVQNAEFNNFNLLNGSTQQIMALASPDGQHKITVAAQNMSLSGPIVTITNTASITTQASASAMITTVENSLTNVDAALAQLGSGSSKLSVQTTFVQNLSNTLTAGIGNLVDADMATESALLQSLQVKQQLGVQALSIANQQPQIILSLLKSGS